MAIEDKSATGAWVARPQLIDPGADATFVDHRGMERLEIDPSVGAVKKRVSSVGRGAPYIEFSTERRFPSETNGSKLFAGIDCIFTDPVDSDTPVFGSDVLHPFKMIIGRDHAEILPLSPPYD